MTLTMEPQAVLRHFESICSVPHGSRNTGALSGLLAAFADENGLACMQDAAGNVIICREGSAGHEDDPPLIMQAHMDMVCEKDAGVHTDMEKEPVSLVVEGDIIRAAGTTLGADDGIGCAYVMAALTDPDLVCPPLECIFTTDEEIGMLGAAAIDLSGLKGRRLLNLDSESEGILTVGCAGGAEQHMVLPVKRKNVRGHLLELTVSGLAGGHSGEAIGTGRANADLLIARLLYELQKQTDICLLHWEGGTKDNAIPREACCELLVPEHKAKKKINAVIEDFRARIAAEYAAADPDISIGAVWGGESRLPAAGSKRTRRIVRFFMALPNGLLEREPAFPDLARTSLSLGIVRMEENELHAVSLIRSSVNSSKFYVMDRLEAITEAFGGTIETPSIYPAWEYRPVSSFRDLVVEACREQYGKDPEVYVTHGGLECGIFSGKIEGLDCVALGPDMAGIHTPQEHISIESIGRTWELIRRIIEKAAE